MADTAFGFIIHTPRIQYLSSRVDMALCPCSTGDLVWMEHCSLCLSRLAWSLLAPSGLLYLTARPNQVLTERWLVILQRTCQLCAWTDPWPTYWFTSLQIRSWRNVRVWAFRWQHRTRAVDALFPFMCMESIRRGNIPLRTYFTLAVMFSWKLI